MRDLPLNEAESETTDRSERVLGAKTFRTNARWYIASAGCVAVLDAVRNLVVAHLLGPYVLGLCTTLLIIPQIAHYLYVGLIETLPVLVPYHRGKKNDRDAESLNATVWNVTLLVSCLLFVGIVFYVLINPAEKLHINIYVILAGFLIVLWQVKKFLLTCYIVDGKIVKVSLIEFWFAFLATLSSIIAVYYLEGYGFWLGVIIPNLVIISYGLHDYLRHHEIKLFDIDCQEVRRMTPLSLVMLMSLLSYTPFIIASRVFLAVTVGVHEVGLFVLSTIIIAKISILPTAVAKIMLPPLSLLLSDDRNWSRAFGLVVRAQIYTFSISCGVILLGMLLLEPVVSWLLPDYMSGVPAARMMLLAGIPYSVIHNANNVLLALQQKVSYLGIIGATVGLQLMLFAYLLLQQDVSAYSVSTILCLVFLCYAVLSNWRVAQLYRRPLDWVRPETTTTLQAPLASYGPEWLDNNM